MIYDFNVSEDKISLTGTTGAKTGSLNYYQCRFTFSDDWNGMSKFAVFVCGDDSYTVMAEDNICFIPAEVLDRIGTVYVGVYGISENNENSVRISTDFAHIIIEEGAYRKGDAPKAPTPDLWEEYFRTLAEKSTDAANAAIDSSLGDISEALDRIIAEQEAIIAIQNALIGGESA